MVETPKLVREAHRSDLDVEHAFFPLDNRWSPDLEHELTGGGVTVFGLKPTVFDSLSDTRSAQGAFAVVAAPPLTFDQRFAGIDVAEASSVLVLVDVADPGNVGTLIRTAEATACAGMIVAGDTADVLSPKVVRSSAGSVLRVPIAEVEVDTLIGRLAEHSFRTLATSMDGTRYDTVDTSTGRIAWLLGNEAHGLRPELLEAASQRVSIPMAGMVESLNVATAGAILLFDHARRRENPDQ